MRYVTQAITALYGADWQGAVVFEDDGETVAKVIPTEGYDEPNMDDVAAKEAEISPRLDILAQLHVLDSTVSRITEDNMKLLNETPTSGPLFEAIVQKQELREQLNHLAT